MEPPRSIRFSLRRKKKSKTTDMGVSDISIKTPSKRRRSSLGKMSVASLLSPVRPMKRVTQAIQRSLSLKSLRRQTSSSSMLNLTPPPRSAPPAIGRMFVQHEAPALWSESLGVHVAPSLSRQELLRQETIHELWCGEQEMVADLVLLFNECVDVPEEEQRITTAHGVVLDELLNLLRRLLDLHTELFDELTNLRLLGGEYQCPADVLEAWLSRATLAYCAYCSQLVRLQLLLSTSDLGLCVSQLEARWRHLTTCCRKRSFVDMLDTPRNRLVKYPLLLSAILKRTSCEHEAASLSLAAERAARVLHHVNQQMGVAKAQHVQQRILYPHGMQFDMAPDTQLLCDGQLKTSRGVKLQCFLFREALLLTRRVSGRRRRSGAQSTDCERFQLEQAPLCTLLLDATPASDDCSFAVRCGVEHYVTLRARDCHDRQLWMSQIRAAAAAGIHV